MDWWQILLIIVGALVAGGLVGVLVSYLISLLLKKPLFQRAEASVAPAAAERPESGLRRLAGRFSQKPSAQPQETRVISPEPSQSAVAVQPATVTENPPTAPPAEETEAVEEPAIVTTELLAEVEQNLKLATNPSSGKLVPFQTKVWDLSRNGLQTLPVNVREDLTQAYVDIRLANSIIWLSTELGRRSPNLDESYTKLCGNIATRLNRVTPQLK